MIKYKLNAMNAQYHMLVFQTLKYFEKSYFPDKYWSVF